MLNWFRRKAAPSPADDRWLIARTQDDGFDVLFRMRAEVPHGIIRADYPRVITIHWPYDGAETSGMPSPEVHAKMCQLEERLDSLEGPSIGFLVVSITGKHQKEWVWHVASDDAFMGGLNGALLGMDRFPIEFDVRDDGQWETFDVMRSRVRG